jgi:hypothetical protein
MMTVDEGKVIEPDLGEVEQEGRRKVEKGVIADDARAGESQNSLPKYRIFPIQTGLLRIADKELWGRSAQTVGLTSSRQRTYLRLVGIRASIGHRDHAARVELECLADLVRVRLAPYALPALARPGRVAALHHECLDVAVEDRVRVCPRSAQSQEVLINQ